MYDGKLPGIGAHADDSQLQINIYLTPSEANLWTSDASLPSGGLVVYGVGPPKDWRFEKYNSESKNSEIQDSGEGRMEKKGQQHKTTLKVHKTTQTSKL